MTRKKIILIQPPLADGTKLLVEKKDMPFGLAYVARSLLKAGFEVEVFDIYGSLYYKNSPFFDRNKVIEKIRTLEADFFGIGALSTQYSYVKWLVSEIKKHRNEKIILGGKLATYTPDTVLNNTSIDICVIGEGEETIVDLLNNMDLPHKVDGIAFKENGRIVTTKSRPYIKNIDEIGLPPYELFDMNIYTDNFLFFSDRTINIFGLGTVIGKKYKAASILTGRGCPYNCHFCSKSFSGFRFRSINNLIEELNYLKENYNINAVHFSDELAVWNRERTLELIQKIKPLNLLWDCQGRANTVDYDLLKKMKGAGCVGIGFGIESGSNEILKRMNKKITVEQSERAMKAALRAGLMVKVQMMIGYPGETRETVMQTVDLMKRCHSYGRRLAITTPLPGSQLYDDCKSQGFIKNEAEYLEKLIVGYGGDTILVNFTNMSDEELVELKREAEQMMVANYVKYLLWHPIKLLEALLPILKDYVEFFFLYLKNQEIRKKTHRFIKKRILNVLS